jgi:hypothetical protein
MIPPTPPPDPLDRLSHLLIRAYNGDDLDPFLLRGHPAMPQTEARLVRACFYYAVVMTPKATWLFDNDGRGGMCEMAVHEIAAVWRTPRLLAALGTDFEAVRSGAAAFTGAVPPPDVDLFAVELGKAAASAAGAAPSV